MVEHRLAEAESASALLRSAAVVTPAPKVLHALASDGALGGVARRFEETLGANRAAGIHPRAWVASASRAVGSPIPDRLIDRGIEVEVRKAETALDPLAIASLTRALRRLGAGAVLHSHGDRALLWGTLAAAAARVPHVHTPHPRAGDLLGRGGVRVAVRRRLLGRVDRLVAFADGLTEGLAADVVPPALDPDVVRRRAPDRDRARAHLALTPNERCFLFLGALSVGGGADTLGVVQAELEQRSAASRLFVAGSGPLSPGVEAMTDVRLLGRRADPETLLAAADVLLLPRRTPGVSMAALEAAALSVPAVGFAVPGLGDSGLVLATPPERVDALVEGGLRLIRDPELGARVLARARGSLEREHGVAALGQRLRGTYEALGG